MDQDILVKEVQALTAALDETQIVPRAVVIAISSETTNWKIWVVPKNDSMNKQEFYRIVSDTIIKSKLHSIDIGSIELRPSSNAAIIGLSHFIRMKGIGSAQLTNNTFNGILLPDGIVIRMDV